MVLAVLVSLAAAAPYAASHWISLAQGPWAGQAVQHDGSVSSMHFDVRMPPPDWLALPPGALIAAASTTRFNNRPGIFGRVEFAVPMSLDALKLFFNQTLSRQGLAVHDEGLGVLDARAAAVLGVSGVMTAADQKTGRSVQIQFREEEGWFRKSRQVQLGWRLEPAPVQK